VAGVALFQPARLVPPADEGTLQEPANARPRQVAAVQLRPPDQFRQGRLLAARVPLVKLEQLECPSVFERVMDHGAPCRAAFASADEAILPKEELQQISLQKAPRRPGGAGDRLHQETLDFRPCPATPIAPFSPREKKSFGRKFW
jgi:hypothetical protein